MAKTAAAPAKGSKFAALSSVPAAKKPAKATKVAAEEDDEDPERKKKDGESDSDYAKRMEDMDEKEKQAKAEGGKEGDDDDDDEKKKAAHIAEGYKMAHTRWSTVLASDNAAGRVSLACQLLDDTPLTAEQIDGVLAMSPIGAAQAATPLARRMAAADIPTPAIEGGAGPAKPGSDGAIIAQCLAAAEKARGGKPTAAANV